MSKVLNRSLKIGGEPRVIGGTLVQVIFENLDGQPIECTGTTVPTSGNFAKGCRFIKTDASSGTKAIYENQGTTTSPSFNLMGEITGSEVVVSDSDSFVDGSGNEIMTWGVAASATNNFKAANAATGNAPVFSVVGDDANIDMRLESKGTGVYEFYSDEAGATGSVIRLTHESASPLAGDVVGRVLALGEDSASNTQEYGRLDFVIVDPTSTTESGRIDMYAANASGTSTLAAAVKHDGSNGIIEAGDGVASGVLQSSGNFDVILRTGNSTTGSVTIVDGANGDIALAPNGAGAVTVSTTLSVDTINEVTPANGVIIDGITLQDGGALAITGGTNTFNMTNGTANFDVAAGATVNIDASLTVESASVINQDLSTDATGVAFASLNIGSSTQIDGVLDEDGMGSDSNTKLATQQSIKAYVDTKVATVDTLDEVFHLGNTITVANTENLTLTLNYNDTTNNGTVASIINAGTGREYSFQRTDGGTEGAKIELYHNSASPLADDAVGVYEFSGNSSTGAKVTYGEIRGIISDTTNTAEISNIAFSAMNTGTLGDVFVAGWSSGAAAFLEIGDGTAESYLQSGGSQNLVIQTSNAQSTITIADGAAGNISLTPGTTGRVVIGGGGLQLSASTDIIDANSNELLTFTQTASAVNHFNVVNNVTTANPILQAAGDDANIGIRIEPKGTGATEFYSDEAGATGVTLESWHESSSPAIADDIFVFSHYGEDDGSGKTEYAKVNVAILTDTAGAEEAYYNISTCNGASGTALALRTYWLSSVPYLDLGDGTAAPIIQSSGSQDITIRTGNATTSSMTITDGANGDITMALDGSGSLVVQGDLKTNENVGSAGTNVTAAEYGDSRVHTTVLTLSSVSLTIGDAANLALGALIYTLPAGAVAIDYSYVSVALSATDAANQSDTPEIGLGTTLASGANATLGAIGVTVENIFEGAAVADSNGTAYVASDLPNTSTETPLLIASGDDHTVYLNYAGAWSDGGDQSATASGTVVIRWTFLA